MRFRCCVSLAEQCFELLIIPCSLETALSNRESSSRREFLAGEILRAVEGMVRPAVDAFLKGAADEQGQGAQPEGGETLRLETRAMACAFSVIMNPGEHQRMWVASDALESVHQRAAEDCLSG